MKSNTVLVHQFYVYTKIAFLLILIKLLSRLFTTLLTVFLVSPSFFAMMLNYKDVETFLSFFLLDIQM